MSDTPRTSSKWEELCCSGQSWYTIAEYMKEDCQDLERELNAVTEQRDEARAELAELKLRLETIRAAAEFNEMDAWG